MGEYFRDRGEDALIIYDDLSKQAVATVRSPCCSVVRGTYEAFQATYSTSTLVCWSVLRVARRLRRSLH